MIRKSEGWALPLPKTVKTDQLKEWGRRTAYQFWIRWGVLYAVLGFLLGRAVIVGELTPFAIPFIAVMYHLRRDKLLLASVAILAGTFSHELGTPFPVVLGIVFFVGIQKLLEKWNKGTLSYTPVTVFCAVLLAQLWMALINGWGSHMLFMAVIEAGLSLVLTLIFIQSIPFLTQFNKKHVLKNEELVCLVILLASVMTGTVGWVLLGLSVEHILARYVILVFAFAAGGAIGATVGVVMGMILSLTHVEALLQLSLLAFSGLLGGLLKEGGKVGVSAGLLIGTLLMGLYVDQEQLMITFNESLLAIALFLLTPKTVFTKISEFIPGTPEHAHVQQDYMKRLRDVTAAKVHQFSHLFEHLSQSFAEQQPRNDEEKERQVDLFLSEVTEHSCQVCFKKEQCWNQKYEETYRLMHELFQAQEMYGDIQPQLAREWSRHCVKSEKVLELMDKEIEQFQAYMTYKKKMNESKRLVADQLSGVSEVMNNFAREIKKEGQTHERQEQQVLEALEDIGLSIRSVEVISLEEGNVEIEVVQPKYEFAYEECEKIIAPLLSDIMGETITVAKQENDSYAGGTCKTKLISAKKYVVQTGIASAAKGGGVVSGDSSNAMDVGNGKYAIAISDGMGNGQRAHAESNETLSLLQHILQSGIDETVAIKSINSVLSLRSTEEIFSTLDLAVVDLQSARTKFLKIGSAPSFIKRGNECLTVAAHNLPMGILQEIEVDVVEEKLKAEDLLIMMTDGIYDAPRNIENKEAWMKRMIAEIETDEPQQVADLLLEKVIRYHQGQIFDDMTVMVAKVGRNMPEWKTISKESLPFVKPQRQVFS